MSDTLAQDWPLRPWLLAVLLGVAGLLIYAIAGGHGPDTRVGWKAAVTALLFFGPVALAFTIERDRWRGPLVFAVLVGAVMAGLAWRAVGMGERLADPEYGFMAGVIATGLALPLFQAGFHRTRWRTDYGAIHGAVWSDAICVAGSMAFLGASWLMLLLLSELFHLLKLDWLRELIKQSWFGWTWSGAAFGAALGVLRNELGIIATLRRVVMTVLALLAVPLAAGLALFLGAMVVSGPDVLWEATRSATPVLLSCAAGAWLLANAILRDDDAAMGGNRVQRVAALVLVLSILPLTVFAAISLGTRVAQHGLSPERLWGLVASAVAVAYGVGWLLAVLRGWRQGAWPERVRRANLHLAVVMCALALVLALPVLDFGAISARQQLARLENGAVSAKKFDFYALQTQFGEAGRETVARLMKSANATIASRAAEAVRMEKVRASWQERQSRPIDDSPVVDYRFADPALRQFAAAQIKAERWLCYRSCVVLEVPAEAAMRHIVFVSDNGVRHRLLRTSDGVPSPPAPPRPDPVLPDDLAKVQVEVRETTLRQVYVDGTPVGDPFE